MGCDIHCYIEYARKEDSSTPRHWMGFGGRINPGRNYGIFGRLAGVRNYDKYTPIAADRGTPEDLGWKASGDNQLYISAVDPDSQGNCSVEEAAKWVKSGYSKYIKGADGKNVWVTNPDHHSHSWATPGEWQAVTPDNEPEYLAMLAAMRSLEGTGHIVRVVFWFDN